MDQTNNGGPAFPSDRFSKLGMSLRDYFAGQALAGMLSDIKCVGESEYISKWAYRYADAMLSERQKERE